VLHHLPDSQPVPAEEAAIRQRPGIPSDAERVLIFAESSHWDPNWLLTAEDYFRRFVAHNMDLALDALLQNPRRVYSLGCLFFLRMYWDRYPARRDQVRVLLNEGRLRVTSSGVTTADTLLPSTEAILRGWLVGQEWLRTNGIEQEPRLAYFVDSFGASPALPSLLHATGRLLLGPASNDLVLFVGSGGPYRMGHEYRGGFFREVSRASTQAAEVEVTERGEGLLVSCTAELGGERYRRALWVSSDAPAIHLLAEGRTPDRHTVAVCLVPGIETGTLTMDAAGGMANRPLQRVYSPTFWPMYRFLHLVDDGDGHGFAIWQALPGAMSYQPGEPYVVANRNATRERVYGLLPIPANPATAHEREAYRFEYAFAFTEQGDWRQNLIRQLFERTVPPWRTGRRAELQHWTNSAVTVDREEVQVVATKPASRGEGIIVRLYAPTPPPGRLQVSFPLRRA
jgi:hypothetical protein